jgi:hypothetical protein
VIAPEVTELYVASPAQLAVIECVPAANALVV